MRENSQILAVMAGYLFFLVAWGIYQGRKVKSDSDFMIAGRDLPGWIAALSERATGESSWALLGLPGAAYATGLMEVWTAIGCVAGILTAWVAIAWRLRSEAEKYRVNSFIEYISLKHNDFGKSIRTVGSLTIVFFFFFYIGAQFLGGGKTLHAMFGIDPRSGMILTALIIIPYTVYGGFRSVVYTDAVQAIVMITALIAGPVVGIITIANAPGIFASTIPQALSKAGDSYSSFTGATGGFAAGVIITGGFSWFFGYLGGQPQLSMRFMAIRDAKNGKMARNIGIAWTILAYMGALSIGWIGLALFGPGGLDDPEYVMPAVMLRIFHPAIAAVLITGAIAAMISTADSLLILSATELHENIIKPLNRRKAEKAKRNDLLVSRFVTAMIAVVALGVAWSFPRALIHRLVGYVWAGIGSNFSVVILLSLFWKRFHGRAALVTIVTGMVFTIIWIASGMDKVITARVMTFAVASLTAVVTTLSLPAGKQQNAGAGAAREKTQ